jgi:hypothetical protein
MVVSSDFHGEVGVSNDAEKPDSNQRRPRHFRPPSCMQRGRFAITSTHGRAWRLWRLHHAWGPAWRPTGRRHKPRRRRARAGQKRSLAPIKGARTTLAHPLARNVAGLQSRASTVVPGGSGAWLTRGARPGGPLAGGTSPAAAVHAHGGSARSLRSKAPAPPSLTPLHSQLSANYRRRHMICECVVVMVEDRE